MSPLEIAKARLKTLLFWNTRAKQLEGQERKLKDSMDPVVAKAALKNGSCCSGRCLWKLDPDVDAERELVEGAKVMGEVPITGVLPSKFVPATTTLDSLKKESAMMKRKAFDIASSSGSDSNDAEVWQQTLTEVEQGWLRGPLDKSEIDPITRRFGLQQGEKVHLIDDYSDSGVNSCVTIDAAAAVLSNWFNVKSQCNQDTDLLVRTFDLKSAYRQIGLHHEGREAAHVAVYCPVKKTCFFFQALVLPFGATRSVHPFLCLARSI